MDEGVVEYFWGPGARREKGEAFVTRLGDPSGRDQAVFLGSCFHFLELRRLQSADCKLEADALVVLKVDGRQRRLGVLQEVQGHCQVIAGNVERPESKLSPREHFEKAGLDEL